ncbi:hypothetical protein QMG83_08970 [Salinibacterium sp. G-O1]|nr:hypothetical protein [Salinibacterium sp. G-O1]MDJ0335353.1 hypothetical protein [Salinibacterium sp. G-O1]
MPPDVRGVDATAVTGAPFDGLLVLHAAIEAADDDGVASRKLVAKAVA